MPPIKIYTTPTCPYCIAAKKLLTSKRVPFEEISVAGDPDLRQQMSEKAGGQTSVPQIWIGEKHIGGSDDLHALDLAGDLDTILACLG